MKALPATRQGKAKLASHNRVGKGVKARERGPRAENSTLAAPPLVPQFPCRALSLHVSIAHGEGVPSRLTTAAQASSCGSPCGGCLDALGGARAGRGWRARGRRGAPGSRKDALSRRRHRVALRETRGYRAGRRAHYPGRGPGAGTALRRRGAGIEREREKGRCSPNSAT